MKTVWPVLLTLILSVAGPDAHACDVDSDCGAGGTCIKREKRARGVCYGGNPDEQAAPAPAQPAVVDPLSMPTERPEGACMVTEECPAGMECVISGIIWGQCKVL